MNKKSNKKSRSMKKYTIWLFFRGQADYAYEVSQDDYERLAGWLNNPDDMGRFFWFSSSNGYNIAINLDYLQAVRFLWDPDYEALGIGHVIDDVERTEKSGITVSLVNQTDFLHLNSQNPDRVYDFFTELEYGYKTIPYPSFIDEDGESIYISSKELVWISAPSSMLEEGHQMVIERDGLTA